MRAALRVGLAGTGPGSRGNLQPPDGAKTDNAKRQRVWLIIDKVCFLVLLMCIGLLLKTTQPHNEHSKQELWTRVQHM